jgi:hypothetical protein
MALEIANALRGADNPNIIELSYVGLPGTFRQQVHLFSLEETKQSQL